MMFSEVPFWNIGNSPANITTSIKGVTIVPAFFTSLASADSRLTAEAMMRTEAKMMSNSTI